MRINLSLEQIFGRNPAEVGLLLQTLGIDTARPYRAQVTFTGVTIEQDLARESFPV
jgi:hypothetical protein